MKRIDYISPVDYMRGSLSGRQTLTYGSNEGSAYDIADRAIVAANDYTPKLVAKLLRPYDITRVKYFQVRTRSTVNMSDKMRHNLALLGGAGAIFAALVNDKSALIYQQCVFYCPKDITLRQFLMPIIRTALDKQETIISVANNVYIVNPWVSSETPNVVVPNEIIDKFRNELSN